MPRNRTADEKSWNTGFGARVERARRRLGLSQAQLGARLPWANGQQTVSKYERGTSTPSPFRLVVLASNLAIPVSELIAEDVPQPAEEGAHFATLEDELKAAVFRLNSLSQRRVLSFARALAESPDAQPQ